MNMKYSLKDFKRAADRHIGDMEPSPEGRARLTRQTRLKTSPVSILGWAAVVAACLIMVALLNLPAQHAPGIGDRSPLSGAAPWDTTGPDGAPSPTPPGTMPTATPYPASTPTPASTASRTPDPTPRDTPEPSASPDASPTGSMTALYTASPAASPSATHRLAARDSALLFRRDDECFVGFDHRGRAYILNDTYAVYDEDNYAYSVDYSDEDFFTREEVLATADGRAYYGVDDPDDMTDYFYQTLWPRPEAVTWLPDLAGCTWVSYYSGLDVGVVQQLWELQSDDLPRYGLASADGLIAECEYLDIFGFTSDGVTIASVPALEGYGASTYRSYGVLNAQGEWVRSPVAGEFEILWADLADNGGSTPVYYMLRTYDHLEQKYDEATGASYIDYDHGPTLIMDLSGNVLMTVDQFGYMYVNSLTGSPTPYKDIETGLWGYVDMDLNIVIEPQYVSAQNFGGGLAAVQVAVEPGPETGYYSQLYGFIDQTGELVIAPQYALVMNGFTDEGGNARVWMPGDGSIQHTIDRNGNDVSSPLSLAWQRLSQQRERVPLDARLSTWALLVLLAAAIAWKRLRSYPDGYGAEQKRMLAGFGGFISYALMYGALEQSTMSALPGLMLAAGAESYDWAAYALLTATALLGGTIYGWAARARCRTAIGTMLSCAAAAALPVVTRWLLCMCTRMDIDAALALALGMAAGALSGADRDSEPAGIKLRLACILLSGLLMLGALTLDPQDLSRREWPATAASTDMEISLSELAEPRNLAELRAHSADPGLDTGYLATRYGEDWQDRLDALLDAPDGYAVLTIDVDVLNPYLKPRTVAVHAYLAALPDADPARAAQFLDSVYEYMPGVQCQLAPLASQTVTVRYLARTGDASPDDWLDELMSCCQVKSVVY